MGSNNILVLSIVSAFGVVAVSCTAQSDCKDLTRLEEYNDVLEQVRVLIESDYSTATNEVSLEQVVKVSVITATDCGDDKFVTVRPSSTASLKEVSVGSTHRYQIGSNGRVRRIGTE